MKNYSADNNISNKLPIIDRLLNFFPGVQIYIWWGDYLYSYFSILNFGLCFYFTFLLLVFYFLSIVPWSFDLDAFLYFNRSRGSKDLKYQYIRKQLNELSVAIIYENNKMGNKNNYEMGETPYIVCINHWVSPFWKEWPSTK